MTSIAKSFWNWLTNKPRFQTLTPLDPELIKENKIIREQAKKIQALEGQLSNEQAHKKKAIDDKAEDEQEKELIKELVYKEGEIEKKKYANSYPLKKLYRKLLSVTDRSFKKGFELVDKDDKVVFDKFKDFVILNNGNFAILGESGQVWSQGPSLRSIMYKPESFGNMVRRKRITLPYDENYKSIPDLESLSMPQISYDEEDGEYHESEGVMKSVKEMIIDREEEIRDKANTIEHLESTISDLRRKTRDIERSKNIYQKSSEVAQTEVSKALEKSMLFESKMGNLQSEIIRLQEQKQVFEKLKDGLEHINNELLDKAEEMGSKTQFMRALQLIQELIDWSKDKLPETIYQNIPQEVRPQKVHAGEKI